jgi:hypothetical protein
MMRGLGLSYVVVIAAYYGVAVAGYAAFGADVSSGAKQRRFVLVGGDELGSTERGKREGWRACAEDRRLRAAGS